ncbi:DUF6366 family protein [Virgibacillus dokdonensis]|uniref:DUF6366 family protein n=1 Tax=Virgibacillus dokdonensis TaxID=302167 RepID=A0ABU7VA67_9BACI|nr:DUF6366 family protein [Virgibacillus dokdonensis]
MKKDGEGKETPERKRERMRQEELNNPSSSIHGSVLSDLVGALGWKGSLLFVIAIAIGLFIVSVFIF